MAGRSPFSFLNRILTNTASFAIGGAIQPTIEPLVIDLANSAWSQHPNRPLSAQAAAEATIRGAMGLDRAAREASYTGFDDERFAVLRALAGDAPGVEEALAAWNRGLIDEATVDDVLRKGRIRPEFYTFLKGLRFAEPSVTDKVRFAVREAYDPASVEALDLDAEFPAAFAEDAARVGMRPSTARMYWRSHWDLPSYTQATEMLHRGEISQGQFDALLKALDYAPTWRAKLSAIATRLPGVSDMVRFAVRDAYTPAKYRAQGLDQEFPPEFAAEAAKHGQSDEDTLRYWIAHWRLPSAEQGFRMLHRGVITEAQMLDLLRALDYPPPWRARLMELAHLIPGRIDLRRMLQADILTPAETIAGYQRLGYTLQDATRLVSLASVTGTTTAKGLTASEVAAEYDSHLLGRAEYVAALRELGYTADAARRKADLADAKRERTARNQLVTKAHTRFVGWRIDEPEARRALVAAQLTQAAQNQALTFWRVEREISAADLTPAQIKKAFRRALMTRDEAVAELLARGYDDAEAATLLDE